MTQTHAEYLRVMAEQSDHTQGENIRRIADRLEMLEAIADAVGELPIGDPMFARMEVLGQVLARICEAWAEWERHEPAAETAEKKP